MKPAACARAKLTRARCRSVVKGRRNAVTLTCKLLCVEADELYVGRALLFNCASRHQACRAPIPQHAAALERAAGSARVFWRGDRAPLEPRVPTRHCSLRARRVARPVPQVSKVEARVDEKSRAQVTWWKSLQFEIQPGTASLDMLQTQRQ
eukprot:5934895-Prymnesium_polylepis.1